MKKQNILICFCKHPEPGFVKSRLAKAIGEERASLIYEKLLLFTLLTVREVNLDAYLYCFPNIHHELLEQYSNLYSISLRQQADGDLGAKMFHAMHEHINKDANVVLIGSDCLEIDADYILRAFNYLNSGYEIILGPAQDGGYALIGANKIDESIFKNICWSTTAVLDRTKQNISKLGWRYKCLSEVRDLDNIDDYEYFLAQEKFRQLLNSQ